MLVDPEEEEKEPFEPVVHNPLVMVTPAKAMTVLESEVCELYSVANSTTAIATKLGITPKTVRNILAKPHIKEFVNSLVEAQYLSKLEGRLRIVNKIIDAKLEKIEEDFGGDFSKATRKDVVDLLVVADNMQKEKQKKELGTDNNMYIQILNQVSNGGN